MFTGIQAEHIMHILILLSKLYLPYILLWVGGGWVRRVSVSVIIIFFLCFIIVMCMNVCSLKWKINKEIVKKKEDVIVSIEGDSSLQRVNRFLSTHTKMRSSTLSQSIRPLCDRLDPFTWCFICTSSKRPCCPYNKSIHD